jgi:sugar lactone lactonase YvrE
MRSIYIAPVRVCAQIAAITSLTLSLAQAQQFQPPVTLARSLNGQSMAAQDRDNSADSAAGNAQTFKENYREFTRTKVAQSAAPQLLTLEFHADTELGVIAANNDFHVTGGTCRQGHQYSKGSACNVEVTFTPQGVGRRIGQLSVSHSASAVPLLVPIGGTAYGPAVSFIPSQINTVTGTFAGTGTTAAGTLSNPQGLAVDGGDNLYIADTGNNLIRFRDSSGTISTFAGGGSAAALNYSGYGSGIKLNGPRGVAVDYSGTVFFTDSGDNLVLVKYLDNVVNNRLGQGSSTSGCTYSSPCTPYSQKINSPYSIATDPNGSFYTSIKYGGTLPGFTLAEDDLSSGSDAYYTLDTTAYNYYSTSSAIGVDAYGNLFYTYEDPGNISLSPTPVCYILGQNRAYSIGSSGQRFWTVAGSGPCGFSGDGGRATGAEIGKNIGQFGWDAAGNFYFADTGNNRVRRVDAVNGVIRTIAGNGVVGYGGDGGPSTHATIQSPTGLAVDSTGRVYTTGIGASAANPGNSAKADIRSFGTIGQLSFPTQATSTHSAALTVLISNVGNDTLNFTHTGFSSGTTADYAVDPNTTSCNFTAPLPSGHSCSIGFIFTPMAVGSRSAVFSVLDDTIEGTDIIQLGGTGAAPAQGVLSPTSLAFSSQAVGTTSAAKTITLSNTGGLTLTINSYTFSGTNAADFNQTHTCGATLAAAANCTISVTFKPGATGSRSASLAISTSSGTLTASLSGTATAAVKPAVALTSSANPAAAGQAIVLTSTVTASSGTHPAGSVQLKEGSKVVAQTTLVNGLATFRMVYLTGGQHVLYAVYLGDLLHQASTSAAIRQMVGPPVHTPVTVVQ